MVDDKQQTTGKQKDAHSWPSPTGRRRQGARPGLDVRGVCRAVVLVIDNRGVTAPANRAGAAAGRPAARVVLADDDVLLREGLASLLDRSGFDVVGQAGNGVELLAQVRSARPELGRRSGSEG